MRKQVTEAFVLLLIVSNSIAICEINVTENILQTDPPEKGNRQAKIRVKEVVSIFYL